MEELKDYLEDSINHSISNIHITDDTNETKCRECEELQKEEPMAPAGSVRGQLHTEPEIVSDEEFQKLERRNFIMKVKIVALDIIDKPLFLNPKDMRNKDKELLIKTCEEVIEKMTPDQVTERFNHIVCRDILSPEMDISSLPIQNNRITHIN
jgi:hypothetical protein